MLANMYVFIKDTGSGYYEPPTFRKGTCIILTYKEYDLFEFKECLREVIVNGHTTFPNFWIRD